MILGRVPKQPAESFKVGIDFVRILEEDEHLVSHVTTARDLADDTDSTGALLTQDVIFGTIVEVRVSGGAAEEDHRVQMRVTTSFFNVYEYEFDVNVRET